MKKTTSKQANSQFHQGHQQATGGKYTTLRVLLVILLCGCLSAGSLAWGQSRSSSTSTSRSTSRTSSASDARTEKKAAESRTEKKATETQTERKATETRSSGSRNEPVKKEADKPVETTRSRESDERREPVQQNTVRQGSETRQVREPDGGERSTRGADIRDAGSQRRPEQQTNDQRGGRQDDSRAVPSTRLSSGYRLVPGSRNPERIKVQLPDIRFRHDYERCTFCFGVGFIFSQDRLHRIRCPHCYGRGFGLEFISQLDDVCPICYGPVSIYGSMHRRSIQSTATYVVNRLDRILDLSNSQERTIRRIILEYLRDSHYGGWYDLIVSRDRAIMRELSYRQREIYMDFMNNVDSRDLCDRCFDYF